MKNKNKLNSIGQMKPQAASWKNSVLSSKNPRI